MPLEILVISPPAMTEIGKDQALVFDVRDSDPLGGITVSFEFPRIIHRELVFDNDPNESNDYENGYNQASSVVSVSDAGFERWRFSVRRFPHWPGTPRVRVTSNGGTVFVPGPPGPEGPIGPAGPAGPQGAAGPAGTTTLIPYQTVLGNPDETLGIPEPISVHTELDWLSSLSEWRFDGINDYIELGKIPGLQPSAITPYSVSAWYQGTADGSLIAYEDDPALTARGWALFVLTGKLYACLFNDITGTDFGLQFVGDVSINDGQLHHCLLTYDGSTNLSGFNGYVDGVLQTKTAPVDNLTAGQAVDALTATLNIGARNRGELIAGLVRHVAFFDKELNPSERGEVYNNGVPPDLMATSVAANLEGWWKIDGTDSTVTRGVLDYSGSGRHGTVVNGLGGGRWLFDGVINRVSMGDVLDKLRTDTFSVFGWCATTSTAVQAIISKAVDGSSPGWRLLMNQTAPGSIRCVMIGTGGAVVDELSVAGTAVIPLDGTRHFVGFTKTVSPLAAGVTIYIDGVATASIVIDNTLTGSTLNAADLMIGARTAGSFFNGQLKDVSVWNRVLTAPEVATLYGDGVPADLSGLSFASALEAWWVLDENDTQTTGGVTDRSVFSNNGTPNFAPEADAQVGSIIARGQELWTLIQPGTLGLPFVSNGLGALPSFRALAANAFRSSTANSVLGNPTAALAAIADIALAANTVLGRVGANVVAAGLVNAQISAAAAIALSKLATQVANSIVGNGTAGVAAPTALAAATTNLVFGRQAGNVTSFLLAAAQMADSILLPAKLATIVITAGTTGVGIEFCVRLAFAAGVGGAADDVNIFFTPNQTPFKFSILDVIVLTTTSVAGTVTLRDTVGGGGAALSSVLTIAASPGTVRNADTTTKDVAANTNIFLNRSDNTIGGEVIIFGVRT